MVAGTGPNSQIQLRESVWTEGASAFMSVAHSSQARVLHPTVARVVNACEGSHLLDFGAGDGRLMELIDSRFTIDAYDNSSAMRAILRQLRANRVRRIFEAVDGLQKSMYDVVVLSMVLICLPTDDAVNEVLASCRGALRPGGTCVVAVTHPCFRRDIFSNFRTSFGNGDPESYLRDGEAFTVTLEDSNATPVSFIDYHWSLGHTLRACVRAGFQLNDVIETPDDIAHPRYNPAASPFLILTCTRPLHD